MHLWWTGFIYSICGPFTKSKERIQKFKETGDSKYIYLNKKDMACFPHGMTFRTAANKICDKVFDIAKNSKYDWY